MELDSIYRELILEPSIYIAFHEPEIVECKAKSISELEQQLADLNKQKAEAMEQEDYIKVGRLSEMIVELEKRVEEEKKDEDD